MTGGPLDGIRLVVLDLDGTLLPTSKRLSQRAVRVVRDLQRADVQVTLATGKGWTLTERYARELGIEAPLVALEGALVARPGEGTNGSALRRRTLSADVLHQVHETVGDLDLGFFYCHAGGRTCAHRRLESRLDQILVWDPHVDLVDARPERDAHEAYVLHLVGEPDRVHEARVRVEQMGLRDVELFHAEFWDGWDQLHVRPSGIGKHEGLRSVLDDLRVDAREMLACGDWWNDVEMLEMAGVAVAPANAVEGVRAVADHVLAGTSEDDAVVEFLELALDGRTRDRRGARS